MSILDNALSRIMDSGDDRPLSERIAEERRELKADISELEDRIQYIESSKGRKELLREVDSPEELGRRRRELRDRLEGLQEQDSALAERQKAAKLEEQSEELEEMVDELPALADEFEAAERRLRETREELEAALTESRNLWNRVRNETRSDPAVTVDGAALRQIRGIAERLDGWHGRLDHLEPPAGEDGGEAPPRVYDARTGETHHPGGRPDGEPTVRRAEA